jgi:ATP-dependent RNA helicase DeaD
MHGDMTQQARELVVRRLREGQVEIVIATDVAARGLDVERITHVINHDVPFDAESYVHRIGRTGRAGETGVAVTFVGEWDFDEFERLREKAGVPFRREVLELYGR